MTSAFAGRLRRLGPDSWAWADGTPEPRVRDLRLRDLAPNWRVVAFGDGRRFVEVPIFWRDLVRDPDVRRAVADLVRVEPETRIYAEGVAEAIDDHRRSMRGCLVPLDRWDDRMAEVVGAAWDRADEPAIVAKAASIEDTPLDTRGVAEILETTPAYVRNLRHRGQLPEPDGWVGRSPWWRRATIEDWLRRR
jgi:hypothetical protein